MSKLKCETCRYWDKKANYPEEGSCRVNAPTIIPGCALQAYWPETQAVDWCGQHEEPLERPSAIEPLILYPDESWVRDIVDPVAFAARDIDSIPNQQERGKVIGLRTILSKQPVRRANRRDPIQSTGGQETTENP